MLVKLVKWNNGSRKRTSMPTNIKKKRHRYYVPPVKFKNIISEVLSQKTHKQNKCESDYASRSSSNLQQRDVTQKSSRKLYKTIQFVFSNDKLQRIDRVRVRGKKKGRGKEEKRKRESCERG